MSDEQENMSNEKREARNESQSSAPNPQHSTHDTQSYPVDPRMMAAVYGQSQEDEIDLLEYWRTIWDQKILILSISFAVAVLAAGISLLMPNIYRAEVLLSPVTSEGGKGGGLSSALGGLSGLASLAGVSLPSGGNVEENLAVLNSREFLWKFIEEDKLMPILFEDAWDSEAGNWKQSDPKKQPSKWAAYRIISGVLKESVDNKSGLINIGIEWTNAEQAADWANALVARLNKYLRQKAIDRSRSNLKYLNDELARTTVADMRQALFELIAQEQKKAMLANAQEQFAFRVLDSAVAPDKKLKPKRSLIVVLAAFVAGFLAVVFVLLREGLRQRKRSDEDRT